MGQNRMGIDNVGLEQKELAELAMRLGVKKIGFADLSRAGHPLTRSLPVGISLILPMDRAITDFDDDRAFHEHQFLQRDELERIKARLGEFLTQCSHQWHSIGNDMDQERLFGELSHKMAAAMAGLGWIGKSSLLVTPEYGPRVRLTTLLTDAPFATSPGTLEGNCGNCRLCVEACPVGALKNTEWRAGMERDALIDAFLCSDYRLRLGDGLGRKHSCAYCLRACPAGKKKQDHWPLISDTE